MQCEMVQNYKFKKVKAKNILLAFNAMQKKKIEKDVDENVFCTPLSYLSII